MPTAFQIASAKSFEVVHSQKSESQSESIESHSLFVRQYVVVAFNINNHYVLFFELVSTEAVVEFY